MSSTVITRPRSWAVALLLLCLGAGACAEDAAPSDEDVAKARKAKRYAEVVMRLKGADLATDAETRALVEKALVANRGQPAFVEIVEAFAIKDQDAELLKLAVAHAADATGAQALRLVLTGSGLDPVAKVLAAPGQDALAIATALGNANDQRAVALLEPLLADGARDLALRQEAVRALSKYEGGAHVLLDLRKAKKLPVELRALSASVLANAPWDSVRAEVAASQPAPATSDGPLPPIAELAKKPGDQARGAQVFAGICVACHQVDGKGVDYGPKLTEIGSKLGKDALFEAVIYPDAGIEFNFETTVLTLKDGNTAIGIVVSDTDQEVALKAIGGIVTKYQTATIAKRTKQKTSSMPTGLQAGMTQQSLVDLIEYLAGLKKK
ncbi:MAG: c-type cytochrome [Planctomycetes bacterium]|nr:c-type cytochrome [Planctomycetota bacterium]